MELVKPLSKRRRIIQLTIAFIVFFIVGPMLILISSGYSVSDVWSATKIKILKTGGIYVADIGSGATVTLDGKTTEESSFLSRTVLFQRLAMQTHTVTVTKPEYREWKKQISVYPNAVTEVHPVLLKKDIVISHVSATSTLMKSLKSEFLRKEEENVATSTEKHQLRSELSNGVLSLVWKDSSYSPYYLCNTNSCVATTTVSVSGGIVDYEWYPDRVDGLVVVTPTELNIIELDARNGRVATTLSQLNTIFPNFKGKPALVTYRGTVYLRLGNDFFSVDL